MRKFRRTKIVVEKERLLVVRSRRCSEGWCEECGAAARLVGLEEAAVICGLSQREVFGRVEAGELHFKETAGGRLYVCINSLLASASARGKGERG